MFDREMYGPSREENYQTVIKQAVSLMEDEPDKIANLSNLSALLAQFLQRINWVGFYLFDGSELVLGPFQGLPACTRIPIGKGVCGKAASERTTLVVADVHCFPGHIACDAASRSEIVVPMVRDGRLIGVLDVDSPETNRFDETDRRGLEAIVEAVVCYL